MSQPSQHGQNVNDLFSAASSQGVISPASMKALSVPDIGAAIQDALGLPAISVQSSEVVLVTMLIDDSGSIRFAGNSQAVRDGHNLVIEAMGGSKQGDSILAHVKYLNGLVLYPYSALDKVSHLDSQNYDPRGGTPLYDQLIVILGTVLAKSQELADNGIAVRTVTLILTDGKDEHSRRIRQASGVAPIVRDMLMQENHIIAAMGIEEPGTDFRQVFSEMGIPDNWILTPKNTPSEIRKAFQLVSKSAVRASQSAASFSKTALGGFATTN